MTANFGRQCLMTRRFSERGVCFVRVTHSDSAVQWDQHNKIKEGHAKNALEVDRPIAALPKDLEARRLLQDTLVLWEGEFGRTPTAQGADGRDHNPEGFTMWMAGGGVKAGFKYGATDDYTVATPSRTRSTSTTSTPRSSTSRALTTRSRPTGTPGETSA